MTSPYGGGFGAYQPPGGGLGAGTPLGGGGAPGSLLGGDRYGHTPMTGGQGAMGSAGRYGGSLLAGGGAYQGGGLGAGGGATLAGSGHDHGSYGDLRATPGSGIGRHQQPFAPMLFSSPGASALGTGGRGGQSGGWNDSPAPGVGAQGSAHGRAGTAGYFTGGGGGGGVGGAGPTAATPGGGSHHRATGGSFFGGGDVTPASTGRRVFGANRENQPRTSDGDGSNRAGANTGGSLRSGAGGKSGGALDSGHVGTPWGDKGVAKGVSPVRGLNAFADAAVVDDDDDGSTTNEAWVTVFGFPPGSLASVLEAFQRDGDVVTHDSFVRQGSGSGDRIIRGTDSGPNWVHVRFATGAGAARALRRNGTKVSGVMVGVRRLDDDARAVVEREHGGAGLLAASSTGDRAGTPSGRRIVRPVAGMSAPGARPSRFQPSREGVALQPRRSVWNNIVEIVFGL